MKYHKRLKFALLNIYSQSNIYRISGTGWNSSKNRVRWFQKGEETDG